MIYHMKLRPYQDQALAAVLREWESVRRTLLVLPTGTGKTIVFAHLTQRIIRGGGRVLILAHRDELIRQAVDKLFKATGIIAMVEKAEEHAGKCMERVIVASKDTLLNPARRDAIWTPTHIIIDEAHRSISESYQAVLNHWPDTKVLGVTATPDRGDLRSLGSYFHTLAFQYPLTQAVVDGYLCKFKALTIPLLLDATGLQGSGDDFTDKSVATMLERYLPEIGREIAAHCKHRKLIVFAPLCDTSKKVQAVLNKNGLRCYYCDGTDRSQIAAFEADGPGSAMVNAMLLTEGYDHPAIDAVCVLRATRVRSLFAQMIGRGTRLFPGKDHLLIVDFLWQTKDSSMGLCRPASLVCEDEEVAEAVTKRLEASAGTGTEMDAALLEEARQEVIEQREAALAKKLSDMRHKKRDLVDPLQYAVSIKDNSLAGYQPVMGAEMAPPSALQIDQLAKAGIFPGDITSAGHAQALLVAIDARSQAGLAQPKQVKRLEIYGYKHAGDLSKDAAQRMINRIAANHWRLPDGLRRTWEENGVYST